MKLAVRLAAVVGMMAAALGGISACGDAGAKGSGKLQVVTTIFAYYDIVRSVGGDKVDAVILLDPNASPHEFQASPADKERVSRAKLIVKNGLGIDDWKVLQGTGAELLEIGTKVQAKAGHDEHEGHGESKPATATAPDDHAGHHHEHGLLNPHVWLDPHVQMKATELVRDALVKVDPANKATYEANAAAYLAELRKLDEDFAAAAKTFIRKEFIGFHSAYDYLADRYGLEEVAAIEDPGGGLSPAQVDKVIALIKDKKVSVVFAEDAFSKNAAERIVKQTGATLGTLQPLETYRSKSDTYVSLMRQNLEELKRTLK